MTFLITAIVGCGSSLTTGVGFSASVVWAMIGNGNGLGLGLESVEVVVISGVMDKESCCGG